MRCAGGPQWHVIVATRVHEPLERCVCSHAHCQMQSLARLQLGVEKWHDFSMTMLSASANASAVPPAEVLDHIAEHSGAGGDS